ncbi:superoxide dismutase family protein [Pedobacter chinensis]|uniref:Superoxide dismutase [Cu-Zn] n=1 Tax=Pedobacter chinensis TaxID=2282421 RepID=A0A369Q182_9SPHI|nr:superoxide dismutase family protein [Pedobacter chinensis]RDC56987.1 superoxide dismutase family protein [Pedobacter chinensis]
MKKYLLSLAIAGVALVSACSKTDKEIAQATLTETADNSKTIGTAKFYELNNGKIKMDIEIDFASRADSTVAVHFHEHGDCGNMGENTHGHWNPTNEAHGQWGSPAYHSGDIGNIVLDPNGKGKISVTTDRWSVKDGEVTNIIGRGIIVHGGTDDYKTQPTGNSGPRVGCGVIEAVK